MNSILIAGDLHRRKTAPISRTDAYFETQQRKLHFICETAVENKCAAIAFPGDIFDMAVPPHGLVESTIRILSHYDMHYLFVFGQHDLRYHTSDKINTPLGVVAAALKERAIILDPDTEIQLDALPHVSFRGCSWGQALPQFTTQEYSVLVLHRPVTMDQLPWDHDDLITAEQLLEQTNADVCACGDNHTRFFFEDSDSGRLVINQGSILRSSSAQVEHRPAVCLLTFLADMGGFDVKQIPIPIRKNVFDMQKVQEQKERDARVEKFVASLTKEFDASLSFKENLRKESENAPKGVQRILEEVLQ